LTEAALKGPDAATKGLSCCPKSGAKAPGSTLAARDLLTKASLKGANAALKGARSAPKACAQACYGLLSCAELPSESLPKLSLAAGELASSCAHSLSKLASCLAGNVLDLT